MLNKSSIPTRCRTFAARFEDHLGGAPDLELDEHLNRCANCRAALEDARLAGSLLREAWQPASEPSQAFLANVMGRIHQEEARVKSGAAFWAPFEFLASRLSLTAAVLLLALSGYLVEFAPHRNVAFTAVHTEISASDFPQPPGDPVSNEEVLQSLAERNNGR